jgi:hypothetical protein
MRFVLLLLLAGCRTPLIDGGTDDAGTNAPPDFAHVIDMAFPPSNEPCTAWSYLNDAHFADVAAAIKECLDDPAQTICQFHPTWIYFPNVSDIGEVSFNWGDNFDGTFAMFAQGKPDIPGGPMGIFWGADAVPGSVGFHQALRDFFLGSPPTGCTWR